MQRSRVPILFGSFLAFISGFIGGRALAATPSFTIWASNVTMPSSGTGSIPFTLTSVNGYSGTVMVHCDDYNAPEGAKLPICGGSVAPLIYTLTANQVLNESSALSASPVPCTTNPCPVKLTHRQGHGGAASLMLAAVLLLGLGLRRRAARWLTLMLLAVGTLAGLAEINACGGGSGSTLTPGVWPYTFVAADTTTNETATTTVNVTVPPGISSSL